MKGALFGNVGSLMAFEVSADDATQLAAQFDHHFKPEALTGLRQYEIAVKLPKREGNPAFPFKAYTLPIAGSGYGAERRDNIIAQSRMMFGRSRERVERSIARALLTATPRAKPVRSLRTPAVAKQLTEQPQAKPAKRCTHCNEAGFLELRNAETGELSVHRCPHKRELVLGIEARLKAYRIGGGKSVTDVV